MNVGMEIKSKIVIYDAIMGSGKTYDAIQRMKQYLNNDQKFIYVTPFRKEIDRIQTALGEDNVTTPDNQSGIYDLIDLADGYSIEGKEFTRFETKREHFLWMTNQGKSIITTHALFMSLNDDDYSIYKDYVLILDEVVDPLRIQTYKVTDFKIMDERNLISVDEDNKVTFIDDKYDGTAFKNVKDLCNNSDVYFLDNYFFVWVFPHEIFVSFKSVEVLTYLFTASSLRYYFDMHEFSYEVLFKDESEALEKIMGLLKIYEGKANKIGDNKYVFSKKHLTKMDKTEINSLKNSISNLLKRNFQTESEYNAFTTFKDFESKLKGHRYSRGFISVNARATNDYSHKKSMVYLANRFHTPQTVIFFNAMGVQIDEDLWALSELIQWMWRGCIRNGKDMNVYIPSSRMRGLLYNWLNGKLANKFDSRFKLKTVA